MVDREPPSQDADLERAIESFVRERRTELAGLRGLLPEESELRPGDQAGDGPASDFEIVRRIGEGGMGVVFEARQRTALGRRVAIKFLRPFTTDTGRERFRREIETVLALDHPGIVPVVAAEVEGTSPFLAMKLVAGVSLTELLVHLHEAERPPDGTAELRAFVLSRTRDDVTPPTDAPTDAWREGYFEWVAQLVVHLCEALQHAHDRGVVHRDVKPGNVVLTPEGRPILLDFGIASTEQDATLTRTGDFVGTLHYSSPEQAAGGEVDGRADVYSVGATLFELLSLRRPHEEKSPSEVLRRGALLEPPPLARTVPVPLRTICRHAMAGDRERRYATPAALAADLRAYLVDAPIRARPPGWATRARSAVRRRPRTAGATLAAAFLLVLVARAGLLRSRAAAQVNAAAPIVAGLADRRLEARSVRGALARWIDEKDAVGRLDGSVLAARLLELRRLEAQFEEEVTEAQGLLEAAFVHVENFARARRALADVQVERIAAALDASLDLFDPARLADLERTLRGLDEEGRHGLWLDATGRVEITGEHEGLPLTIYRDGESSPCAEALSRNARSPDALELAEGSYVAVAAHPDGGESRLPFLVRRDAVHRSDPDALPPRRIPFELLALSERRAGFVHVPAGWTLMGDDPPRWRFVAGFEIQEFEVSFGEYLDWLREVRPEPLEEFLPAQPTGPFILVDGADGSLRLREGIDPDWPLLGLSPDAMYAFAERIEPMRAADPGARYVDLPDPSEWLRAARGADARRFAGGSTFSWNDYAGYYSRADRGMPRPYPIGSFPGDVSPFGARDMTGSVAELQGEYRWERHGGRAVRGGSFSKRTESGMELLTRRTTEVVQDDLGLRLVRRPVPAWMAEPDREPEPFEDDFERPDSDLVGRGWHEYGGDPLTNLDAAWAGDLSWIADGRLVCDAEADQFSASGTVIRRVHLADRFRVRVVLSYDSSDERRALSVALKDRFGHGSETVSLAVTPGGEVSLSACRVLDAGRLADLRLGENHVFELEATDGEYQGRVWRQDSDRPAAPTLRVDIPPGGPPLRFLVLSAPNLVGGRIEVDEVLVTVP